jgi:hypothetical protein
MTGDDACRRVASELAALLPPAETEADQALALLYARCAFLGVSVINGHVSEKDAGKLIGRAAKTLKNRRGIDAPMRTVRYLRKPRYPLSEIARFMACDAE